MKLKVFAVCDRATVMFGNPMFLISEGQAVRSFVDEVNREAADNNVYKHPDDFDLFRLGEFDTESGLFECSSPVLVVAGASAKVRS